MYDAQTLHKIQGKEKCMEFSGCDNGNSKMICRGPIEGGPSHHFHVQKLCIGPSATKKDDMRRTALYSWSHKMMTCM